MQRNRGQFDRHGRLEVRSQTFDGLNWVFSAVWGREGDTSTMRDAGPRRVRQVFIRVFVQITLCFDEDGLWAAGWP